MTVHHIIRRILVLFFLLCLPATVLLAASESYIQTLTGKIKQGDSCVVIDDKFLHLPLNDWNNIQHLSVDNIISFELRFDTSVYFQSKPFTCTLNVSVKYFTSRDQTVPDEINNVDLVVKYDTAKGEFYPADAHYKFKNAFKVVVVVNSITSQAWGKDIPAIFRLKNQILVERKYPFDPHKTGWMTLALQDNQPAAGSPLLRAFSVSTKVITQNNNSQLFISWLPADFGNPEEYDVEWTFIDGLSDNGKAIFNTYGDGATLPKAKAEEWMKNDNTRVTVTASSYTINLPYPKGYVLVRVRGISYQATTNLRLLGDWDYIDDVTGMAVCKPVTAHESGMNYQYTATFAEEGKRKELISYFDATLRERQVVTLNNSDQTLVPNSTTERQETAIVQETFYDKMGRAAVNAMPAPTNSKSLNYYQSFNLNSTGDPYSHTDITLGGNCVADAQQMNANSGASKYYSPGNPFKTDDKFYFTKYVADAQQYPYSLTEYMPDNTGRIRRQGGLGSIFQPKNGHGVQYFYGKPGQRELDRLFGVEVGDCSHYLKNMVIDPNGQATVSYIDANGRTIATALAGEAPGKMDALPSANAGQPRVRMNETLMKPADFISNTNEMLVTATSTFSAIIENSTYTVHYSVNPAALMTTHSQGQFCSNCYYDVLVEVRDNCGAVVASKTTAPFTINDVTCNANPQPVTGDLDVFIGAGTRGIYSVTYTLKLSRNAINYQTDYYIEHNSDLKKILDFFVTELNNIDLLNCYSTCEACKTLGTKAEFRQKVVDLLGTDKFNGILATDPNNTIIQRIDAIWDGLSVNCSAMSCNAGSSCDDYLIQMKADVIPGGQYAMYTATEVNDANVYSYIERNINVLRYYNLNSADNTEIYNFSFVDNDGNTVFIRNLSESDFIRAYIDHPEWADMFVKKHVEYCGYLFCKDQSYSPASNNNEASYNFDKTLRELDNGDEAVSKGYYNGGNSYTLLNIDPFFNNGGRGVAKRGAMMTDLSNFSTTVGFSASIGTLDILRFVGWVLYCKPNSAAGNPPLNWACPLPPATCRSNTLEWQLYRNYYLQLKSKYLTLVKNQISPGCVQCFIGKDALLAVDNSGTLFPCTSGGVGGDPGGGGSCMALTDFYKVQTELPDQLGGSSYYVEQINQTLVAYGGPVQRDVQILVRTTTIYQNGNGSQIDETWHTIFAGQDRLDMGERYEGWHDDNGNGLVDNAEIYHVLVEPWSIRCPAPSNGGSVNPTSSCLEDPNYPLYQSKQRVFQDFTDMASYMNCLVLSDEGNNPAEDELFDKYRSWAWDGLDDMRNAWADQLKAVRDEEPAFSTISNQTIENLADDLREVAIANIDNATTLKAVRPASTIANGGATSKGFHSFADVFASYISSGLIHQGFSQDLLEGPYPFDKTPVGANNNSGELDNTICTNLSIIKNRYSTSGFSGSFYDYLKQELEEDMMLTPTQLQDLEDRCANGCRYLKDPVLLPVAFTTPLSPSLVTPFVDCSTVGGLSSAFSTYYPTVDPTTKLYRTLFTNYLNHSLGYALSYSDYIAFTEKCSLNNTAALFNKPSSLTVPANDFQCAENSIMTAYERGGQEYDRYITLERERFRNLYIAKCLATKASATVEGDQYEYHYTLYYYDQSGNLVKTVPPEGVRFLTESQIDQVQTLRNLGVSTCEDDGITKVEDKVAALNTVSTVLQSNAAQSIELWLNNLDAANGSQVRFITPDNKYMYQAAIANKKLWVELYSLQPGTSGDIAITLSNQMVADISAITIQKWSHLVVQSNGVTGNTWDVYLNGAKLALLPDANSPGYPFSWEISAGFTLPADIIDPVKHIRVYNRLLSGLEVIQNYSNPCFSIAETLQGTNSPLLVWGRFNITSLCNPATELVSVPNQGALQVSANLGQNDKILSSVANNFTVELWVKPQQVHEIDAQSQTGTAGSSGQNYVIYPTQATTAGAAGMGISVGTNGVSVYENATGYMPPLLVWNGTITGFTHVAVVYTNKTPSLYINGQLVKTGLTSTQQNISPSYNFGGGALGYMPGAIDEVRIWNVARTAQEINSNYHQGINPSAVTGLVGYWPMDPVNGAVVADVSCNHNNVPLPGSGYSWVNSGSNIYNTVSRDGLNNFIVPVHGMPTTYAYNSQDQVIKQTSPDGGMSQFWYDRLGKLAVSQNSEQLQPSVTGGNSNRYSYTKYDAFDRVVEVGEKVGASSNMTEVLARDNASLQTWMQSGQNDQITQEIYDEAPTYAPGLLTNLRKRLVAMIRIETGSGTMQRIAGSYYSYDIIGNVKTLYQENSKLLEFDQSTGIKRIDYDYDLQSGKPNKIRYQEGKGDQFYYKYQYDADNRMVEASTSRDGLIWSTEAAYRYYLHGPLARTELGHNLNKVQGLDYAYNLQGWLKGVNSQQLDANKDMSQDGYATSAFSTVARDAIGFTVGYFNNDYQPIDNSAAAFGITYQPNLQMPNMVSGNELFNGNVSHATLAINKLDNGALKGYSYRYDQLNRLKQMRMHDLSAGGPNWDNSSILSTYQEEFSYDGNGNIINSERRGNNNNGGSIGYGMDVLTYNYNRDNQGYLINNKLRHVNDNIPANLYTTDIDDQATDYYTYDKIGNLIKAGGGSISWTAYGKIKDIISAGQTIHFTYDGEGKRIGKTVTSGGTTKYTFYVRDPQGNVLGVYTDESNTLKWTEQHLYGSSRLGMWHPNITITSTLQPPGAGNGQINLGEREYELSNSLGNILATISDSRTGIDADNNGTIDYYIANVLTASDYYSFGMQMPGRLFNGGSYRYGFNGKENDNELYGDGNQQDYGMRIYDPRLGRFLSVDPVAKAYPWYTPYQFAGNKPVRFVDIDGLEEGENLFTKAARDGFPGLMTMTWDDLGQTGYDLLDGFNRNINPVGIVAHGIYGMATKKDLITKAPKGRLESFNEMGFNTVMLLTGEELISGFRATSKLEMQMAKNAGAVKSAANSNAVKAGKIGAKGVPTDVPNSVYTSTVKAASTSPVKNLKGFTIADLKWPNINKIGGTENCIQCMEAGDNFLRGKVWKYAENFTEDVTFDQYIFSKNLTRKDFVSVTRTSSIEILMRKLGDGATGVVFGVRGANAAEDHVLNVIKQNGIIMFVDFQGKIGQRVVNPKTLMQDEGFVELLFRVTSNGKK